MDNFETVKLYNDDGKDIEFEVLGIVTVEEKDYAILHPVTGKQQAENIAYIFQIENDEKGNEIFTEVEDDKEFEKVKNAWKTVIENELEVSDKEDE